VTSRISATSQAIKLNIDKYKKLHEANTNVYMFTASRFFFSNSFCSASWAASLSSTAVTDFTLYGGREGEARRWDCECEN